MRDWSLSHATPFLRVWRYSAALPDRDSCCLIVIQ
jgi:hypothetical protein